MLTRRSAVDWESYAAVYDLMAENNPAYQEVLRECEMAISEMSIPDGGTTIDLGAGTGNLSIRIARNSPKSTVIHVDQEPQMIIQAQRKAETSDLPNLLFKESSVRDLEIEPSTVELVVMVHSLYTFDNPRSLIDKVRTWIRPNGVLLMCDIGRLMNVVDWGRYLLLANLRRLGVLRTFELYYRGWEVVRQNRLIRENQERGVYWTHTLDEFVDTVRNAGFDVIMAKTTYRGYSNMIVARRSVDG